MVRDDLAATPDGEVLRITAGGLHILRRQKHEHDPQVGAGRSVRAVGKTDKVSGSKFNENWPLARIVNFIEEQINAMGWQYPPNAKQSADLPQPAEVGVSDGEIVNTVHIVREGRYVHAYPVKD